MLPWGMAVVSARIVRRIVAVSRGPAPQAVLLDELGLSPTPPAPPPARPAPDGLVAADAYYALLARCAADDPTLPLRYADATLPEDFGAFGLALKTARHLREVLERLARYILVVSDTLEYALVEDAPQPLFVLRGRPPDHRGVQLANECALAAITTVLRTVADGPVRLEGVCFRHAGQGADAAFADWFGAPVTHGAAVDGLVLSPALLDLPTRLADPGLSAFLLSHLAALHAQRAEGAIVHQVRQAIAERLCSGMPTRRDIARQLGMSARTLHRRLAEQDQSFQAVANEVRRDVAETLLSRPDHSIAEVAYLTGFSDQSAFQRAFKSWTGKTPGGVRRAAS